MVDGGWGDQQTDADLPVGLVLLIGPPAAGKSAFARAWVDSGQIDADGVVSCDSVRHELFGDRFDVADDPALFNELDRRVEVRLRAALPVVVDATHVMPHARSRMIAWARRHGRPVVALRFRVAEEVLIRRNAERSAPARVPVHEVRRYAAIAAQHTDRAQLADEGCRCRRGRARHGRRLHPVSSRSGVPPSPITPDCTTNSDTHAGQATSITCPDMPLSLRAASAAEVRLE
ncbi:ATP-binding protein [Dactylosporangium sp. NPDC049525]|uniref:ATP-binding protein n=1 Tax=Dactylosporangium sp. NPDC049525 TaxID=3154730 RepID=UPI0034417A08